jgi:hypothetical protein
MFDMFKGSDGEKVSMMRISTFITTIAIIGTFVAHNVIAMINGAGFVSMGLEEAGLLAATLGLKALQTKFENGTSTPVVEDVSPEAKGN